jgi:prepilin-type N-terminal cleavage/methylation domain-containing protein
MKQQIRAKQAGFSLLEMMMVLGILSLVMGVTMTAINDVQKRARVEEAKVDLNQESREFVEQVIRDLHQAGYPPKSMYAATTPPGPPATTYAVGLVAGDQTSITFEGDVDGDGSVETVQYQLSTDPAAVPAVPPGQCPCRLQRSSLPKGTPGTNFSTEVDQVINSAGGAGAWTVAWSFNISPTVQVQNDVYYAAYKAEPVFRYYDGNGAELVPPLADVTLVRSVRITVNTASRIPDPVTHAYPASSMSASARIANTGS